MFYLSTLNYVAESESSEREPVPSCRPSTFKIKVES